MQQTCHTCHAPVAAQATSCATCRSPLATAAEAAHLRPAMVVPDVPPPRERNLLPWLIGSGAAAVLVLVLVLAIVLGIGLPLFIAARNEARAKVPLREPRAVGGLQRLDDRGQQELEQQARDQITRGGYSNAVVGSYGNDKGDLVYLLAVRTASSDARREFVAAQERSMLASVGKLDQSRVVERDGLELTCSLVRIEGAGPAAWCSWSDGDSAGVTASFGGIDLDRLSELTAEAHEAMTG